MIWRKKAYLDFEKILPWSLSDTEYSDDTRRLELEDILYVDSLIYDQLSCPSRVWIQLIQEEEKILT
jgi:hypothetical protein